MSEGTSASGVLGTLKTAYDLAKDLMDLHDASIRQGKIIELQKQILSAQESAIAAQLLQSQQVVRVDALEAEIARLRSWEAEKDRYRLERLDPGVFVYSLRQEMARGEPLHSICQTCFQRGKKSILHSDEHRNGIHHLNCNECGTTLEVGFFRPPPIHYDGGGGPDSWMSR